MHSKWGFDGSSGHSEYKQKASGNFCEGSLFLTSMVPLQMSQVNSGSDAEVVLWVNDCPSSTRFCRPISFFFHKETEDFVTQHYTKMMTDVSELQPTRIECSCGTVVVRHSLYPCMVDGKVCSVLAGEASCNCHVCGVKPSKMNDLQHILARPTNQNTYQFGVSSLHARIRCLEMVLHISYRLDMKRWRASSADHKQSVQERKDLIQKRFRDELNLKVDFVKQGHGTTNDGNTARIVFRNPEISAKVTGVDKTLISRLAVILEVLSCGRAVNIPAYREYCFETAKIYVDKYSWYYMPQAVHKLLIHSSDIIAQFPLQIGTLTEEAQESRNKDLRNFRENHTRKNSRTETNRDLMKRLLLTSDPDFSSIRQHRINSLEPSEEMSLLLL